MPRGREEPGGLDLGGDLALGFLVVVGLVLVAAVAEDLAGPKRARQPLKTLATAEDIVTLGAFVDLPKKEEMMKDGTNTRNIK